MRAAYHIAPIALLLGAACGRGPLVPLDLQSKNNDGTVAQNGDGGDQGFDGSDPFFDGGPIDGGPFPADGGPNPSDGGPIPNDGGPPTQCRIDADCFDRLGVPICPQGQPGDWDCVRGVCEMVCPPPPPECMNDCDCPFELSCARGRCIPINRNNLCCLNPNCPPGNPCQLPGGGSSMCPNIPPPPDGGVPDGGFPDGGPPPPVDAGTPDAGVTPIGDACMLDNQCAPDGFCIEQSNGFPNGYCSQDCRNPPQGTPCPTGADCRSFGPGQRLCLDECVVTAECRTGYNCVQLGLNTQKVCWPVTPGSTNPNGDPVGSSCNNDQNCATGLTCLQFQGWPGGYCTIQYCDPQNNPCPGGSSCYAFPGLFSLCLDHCPSGGSQSTCRQGYYCLGPTGQPGACIPN